MAVNRRAGLTLVELMLVLVIVGLLFGIVTVNISSLTPKSRIEANAAEIGATIAMAREQAITSGRETSVKFDFDRQKFFVTIPKLDDEGQPLDEETEDLEMVTLRTGVKLDALLTGDDEKSSSGEKLVAFDNQGVSAGMVVLLSYPEYNYHYSVRVNPITGLVQIYPYPVETRFVQENVIGGE